MSHDYTLPPTPIATFITMEQQYDSGIDPESLKKFSAAFPGGIVLEKEHLRRVGFDPETTQKFEELFDNGIKEPPMPRMVLATPYLTKEKLQAADIAIEKIEKFAELFPNGTEVTCEVCVKHPDVFSFGKNGRRLITDIHYVNEFEHIRVQYDHEIMEIEEVYGPYGVQHMFAIIAFRNLMRVKRDDKDKIAVKVGHDPYNPPPQLVALYSPSRPPIIAEENAHKNRLERIEKEYLLEQALAFYKTSRWSQKIGPNNHDPR